MAPTPTPCVTPPACPDGWTRAPWDPLCCVGPVGPSGEPGGVLCYSVECPPSPPGGAAAATVPAASDLGLAALLVAVAIIGMLKAR